jgi:hypothetical protein
MTEEPTNLLSDDGKNAALNNNAQIQKPDGLPDKFWDAENGVVRTDALIKSYIELEKRMSTSIPEPTDEETRARFLRAAGVPASPEEYQIAVKDGLFEPDFELNTRLHAKGFTPEQVQEVYDLAVEKMVPMMLEMASEFQADREIDRLIAHFGGQDQWREASRQMLAFGQKNLPAPVLEGMSSSYEGILALYKMMQSGEPQTLGAKGKAMSSNADKDLQSMMNDPKYWRDKDPAFIAKVTDGFKNLYSE